MGESKLGQRGGWGLTWIRMNKKEGWEGLRGVDGVRRRTGSIGIEGCGRGSGPRRGGRARSWMGFLYLVEMLAQASSALRFTN